MDVASDVASDVSSVEDSYSWAVAEMSAIIGIAAAVGEALIEVHVDTVGTVCECTRVTGHDCVEVLPDGNLRGASALSGN